MEQLRARDTVHLGPLYESRVGRGAIRIADALIARTKPLVAARSPAFEQRLFSTYVHPTAVAATPRFLNGLIAKMPAWVLRALPTPWYLDPADTGGMRYASILRKTNGDNPFDSSASSPERSPAIGLPEWLAANDDHRANGMLERVLPVVEGESAAKRDLAGVRWPLPIVTPTALSLGKVPAKDSFSAAPGTNAALAPYAGIRVLDERQGSRTGMQVHTGNHGDRPPAFDSAPLGLQALQWADSRLHRLVAPSNAQPENVALSSENLTRHKSGINAFAMPTVTVPQGPLAHEAPKDKFLHQRYNDDEVTPDAVLWAIAKSRSSMESTQQRARPHAEAEFVANMDEVSSVGRGSFLSAESITSAASYAEMHQTLPEASRQATKTRSAAEGSQSIGLQPALWQAPVASALSFNLPPHTAMRRAAPLASGTSTGSVHREQVAVEQVPRGTRTAPVRPMVSAPRSLRAGELGVATLRFSLAQEQQSASLAFDFLPPEYLIAASTYGLTPAMAKNAHALAARGDHGVAEAARRADISLVQLALGATPMHAASPAATQIDVGQAGEPERSQLSGRATPLSEAGAFVSRFDVSPAHDATPTDLPRGAFLWPRLTAQSLRLTPDSVLAKHEWAALEVESAEAVARAGGLSWMREFVRATSGTDTRRGAPTGEAAVESSDPDRRTSFGTVSSFGQTPGAEPGARRSNVAPPDDAVASTPAQLMQLLHTNSAAPAIVRAVRAMAWMQEHLSSARTSVFDRAQLAWVASSARPAEMRSEGVAPRSRADGGQRLTAFSDIDARQAFTRGEPVSPRRVGDAAALSLVVPDARSAPRHDDTIGGSFGPNSEAFRASGREQNGAFHELVTQAGSSIMSYVQPVSEARPAAASGAREVHGPAGDVVIPAWFEQAARTMFERRSAADDISVSDLPLITAAAPTEQLAASSRAEQAPHAVATDSAAQIGPFDVEGAAQKVLHAVKELWHAAWWRNNGEPS